MTRAALALFGVAAALASAWLLLGLRNTNHDDHYFEVLAHFGGVSLAEAALWVAGFGRRFAHLLNTPISFLSHRTMNLLGLLGDLAVLGQIGVILGGFGWLLRGFVGGAAAAGWAMLLMGGYALHWYFMPPLAYPLHALTSVMLLAVSLVALDLHLLRGGRGWLALSLLASAFGILWPEFNLLLYPLATFALILLRRRGLRAPLRAVLPFLLVWAAMLLATLSFRFLTSSTADEARMTVALDPGAWAATFGLLVGKAVLPLALLIGVDLHLADVPGMPAWPRRISASLLARVLWADAPGFLLVALAWGAGFLLVLRNLAPRQGALWLLFAAGLAMLVIPGAVIALSAHYQQIVRLGYLQGAVGSAHIQTGYLTLLFASVALVAWRWPHWAVQGTLSLMLGALCSLTLAYNLMMRDVIAANQQRWLAFALMVEALPEGAILRAPSLWLTSGVSAIPANLPFGMENYWTERARIWQRRQVAVLGPDAPPREDEAFAAYVVRPDGEPLVFLRQGHIVELLARRPIPLGTAVARGVSWNCDGVCRLRLAEPLEPLAALGATPLPREGLLDWWLAPRVGGFGARASWP